VEQAAPLTVLGLWRMVMKRSSARRARRWVNQELIRSLGHLSDVTVGATLSSDGNSNDGGENSSFGEIS
jgi:hypothetical protein